VHHELLGHIQLAVFRFNLQNVVLDGNAIDLGRRIINRDVARPCALRRCNKVARTLVYGANQVRSAAGSLRE